MSALQPIAEARLTCLFKIGILLSSLLLLSSCTINRGYVSMVPQGAPKGYVEFYTYGWGSPAAFPDVSEIVNGQKRGIGSIGDQMIPAVNGRRFLQIGEAPGTHEFEVAEGRSWTRRIQVKVTEGMVTPVRVDSEFLGANGRWNRFRISIKEETPIPAIHPPKR